MRTSVIMGVYNPSNEKQLLQAVDSIIEQTMPDWEMIICDDGSDISYQGLYHKIAAKDSRIMLVRNERQRGLASALNKCLGIAKGKYIARMDADDIAKANRLEKQCQFLDEYGEYQWVGSNAELIDEKGVWGVEIREVTPGERAFLKYSPYIHPSVVFRADVLIDNKGYKVAKETTRCEDYELFMRLSQKGLKGFNIQECLLQYREDYHSYNRRKYSYRIQEVKVRFKGFKKLGIMNIMTIPYVLKPLFVGIIPTKMMRWRRKVLNNDAS